jgi:hypothetical protein
MTQSRTIAYRRDPESIDNERALALLDPQESARAKKRPSPDGSDRVVNEIDSRPFQAPQSTNICCAVRNHVSPSFALCAKGN